MSHLLPAVDRRLRAGESVRMHVLGLAARVPATGVGAVHITVTALDSTATGSVAITACGITAAPPALWFTQGRPASTSTFVAPDTTGSVCITVSAPTHLLVDLRGYAPATGGLHAVRPTHVFDTRPRHTALRAVPSRTLGSGSVLKVRFTALGALVPASGVSAVALHLTAISAGTSGSLTAWSCGARPSASSLTFGPTGVSSVTLILAPDGTGSLCFASTAAVHVTADVIGWVATGRSFHPVAVTRVLNARVGTIPTAAQPGRSLAVAPAATTAWWVRLSVVAPDGAGTATVQACGSVTRLATISFVARQSTSVAVVVPANATTGALCIAASRSVRMTLDVDGWFAR